MLPEKAIWSFLSGVILILYFELLWFMKKSMILKENVMSEKIKLVLFDIDGVITDGKKYTDGIHLEIKAVQFKDLDAIGMIVDLGMKVGCISGENTPFSQQFTYIPNITFVKLGDKNKEKALMEIVEQSNLSLDEICYIGDGKYDIPVLKKVGLSICPNDAIEEVRNIVDVRLTRKGGEGCLSEVYTLLKKNRDKERNCKMNREHVFVVAEIGINHNGDIDIAKKLIDWSVLAGCDAVKFQKRTVDKVYSKEYLDGYRESPWGTTQRAQKEGLEFGKEEYDEIDRYCRERGIEWFASAWDIDSQLFLRQYDLKYNKIASAMLTDDKLIREVAGEGKYTFIATGMSTFEEIDHAVAIFKTYKCPFELLHCNSTYPMPKEDANLRLIPVLRERYNCKIGYSGHESGRIVSTSAVALGATTIERHITLDNTMYGSDQAASLNVKDMMRLVEDIRLIETILGNGEKILSEKELDTRKKLRGC